MEGLIKYLTHSDYKIYALRLTPYPNTFDTTKSYRELIPTFMSMMGSEDWLCGQEFEKNHHFHAVFVTSKVLRNDVEVFDEFKKPLYRLFSVPEDKEGNATFSLEEVRDIEKALCYAVKDCNYFSSDSWLSLAVEAYDKSTPKKHSVKRSITDITQDYIEGKINDRIAWIELCKTKSELGLPLNLKWADEMLLSIQCKKDPNKLQQIWEDIEIKKNLRN